MLNLYAVKVWHSSGPRHFETIEVRTYTARRAEDLASESFPGCMAVAECISDIMQCNQLGFPYSGPMHGHGSVRARILGRALRKVKAIDFTLSG